MRTIFLILNFSIVFHCFGQNNRILQFPEINCSEVFQFLKETNLDDEEIIILDGLTVYKDTNEMTQIMGFETPSNNFSYLNSDKKHIKGLTIGSELVFLCEKRGVLVELDSICNNQYELSFNDIINRGMLDKSELIHDDIKRLCNLDLKEVLLFDLNVGKISKSQFFDTLSKFNTNITYVTVNPVFKDIVGFNQFVFVPSSILGQQGRKNKCNKIKNYSTLSQFDSIKLSYLPKKIYLNYWSKLNVMYFQNTDFLFLKKSCTR